MDGDPWSQPASFCDLAKASKDLETTTRCIWDMVEQVAEARVVKEMMSERMKSALARAIRRSNSDSVAKGEVMARCDAEYQADLEALRRDYLVAEKTLGKHAAYHARLEGLRTLISAQKATIQM